MSQRDYFQLYGLEPTFDLDLDDLGNRYRALQRQFHPDRFAGGTATEQRVAAQVSAEVNAAFLALKDPVKRAGYLLERLGVELRRLEREPIAGDFLLTQMELRETVAELAPDDQAGREALAAQARALFDREVDAFRQGLDDNDLETAGAAWVHMLYVNKLRQEVGGGNNQ